MSKENYAKKFTTVALTTAHEVINRLEQYNQMAYLFKLRTMEKMQLSDALFHLSQLTPEPISRALFRLWYNEASKEDIATLRMCAKGLEAHYPNEESVGLEYLNNAWIKAVKSHHDYFCGPIREGVSFFVWNTNTFVSTIESLAGMPIRIKRVIGTIRYMLRYGNKVILTAAVVQLPRHIRNMMFDRNMVCNDVASK